jgi:catechol-2,3-dioxygenase
MKLSGLTLETIHFEDYLSFLTEVLELELQELTDISMRLDLTGTWLEIKKVPTSPHQVASNVEFALALDEYEALKQRVSFFYYRRGPTRFLFLGANDQLCSLVDPDGRLWRFVPQLTPTISETSTTESVRIF